MSTILDLIGEQLSPDTIRQMSGAIGAEPRQTATAVETAVPLLLGALQRNASNESGAASLAGALDRDHDGSILDDLAGFLGQGTTAAQGRSLDHIFGGKRAPVENAVARRSGLDGGQVMKLLAMLAPMVLAVLGKAMRGGAGQGRATAPSSGGGLDTTGTKEGFKKAVAMIPTDQDVIFSFEKNKDASVSPYIIKMVQIRLTPEEVAERLRAAGIDPDELEEGGGE